MEDCHSENFEPFDFFFLTTFKIHSQLSEVGQINYSHSHMRGIAFQTFRNIGKKNGKQLREIIPIIHRNNLKPQPSLTVETQTSDFAFQISTSKTICFCWSAEVRQSFAGEGFGRATQSTMHNSYMPKCPTFRGVNKPSPPWSRHIWKNCRISRKRSRVD